MKWLRAKAKSCPHTVLVLAIFCSACSRPGGREGSGELVSIAISPHSANITLGGAERFRAVETFSNGSTQDVTDAVQWSSSASQIATVTNSAGSNGVAIGAKVGAASIVAASGSVSAAASLTVSQINPINIVLDLSYDSVNPTTRTFGLWYESSHGISDPTMPIVVFIHGGEWAGGAAFGQLGRKGAFVSGACPDVSNVVCYLANMGYAVYSINYTLAVAGETATQWPVQWQDCDCFLKFLAENAGVTVPGDPNKIFLIGHSAGAHLAAMVGLAPHNTFPTNCGHTSVNYKMLGMALLSPPIDLRSLFEVDTTPDWQGVDGAIANLLGCRPGPDASSACVAVAASANPANYVAQGQPAVLVQSGTNDQSIPFELQGALQSAYSALNPPVKSQWIVYGPSYGHDLDIFYYNPCSSGPVSEPSPCGTAGAAFGDVLTFLGAFSN